MRSDSPFLVELLRTAPLGPVLQLVGFASIAILWGLIETDRPATATIKIVWGIGFVALVVGMHLTHRDAIKLYVRRRAARVARSSAPWDNSSGGS